MASPKKYDKGIRSLLGQANRAFDRAVKNSRLNEIYSSPMATDGPLSRSIYPAPEFVPAIGHDVRALPGSGSIRSVLNPPAETSPAAVIASPSAVAAPITRGTDARGNYVPQTALEGSVQEYLEPWADLGGAIVGGVKKGFKKAVDFYATNPDAAGPDAAFDPASSMDPAATAVPLEPPDPEGYSIRGWEDEMRSGRFRPIDAMTGGMVDPRTKVLPPDNTDQPAVVPITEAGPPEIDATGLPGTSSETATGALSLDDYIKKMQVAYPDLDFTNPKQAEADANARRDLDRTAMLAQLQMAAGLVSGAGAGWEGIGQGFANYGGTMDKGFQKYQQTLQDSADRYGKQMESQMAYDTARRQAALGMYTSAQDRQAASQTELWKAREGRAWDAWKFGAEGEREERKYANENINKYFDKELDGVKPASDPSTADPIEEQRKEKIRNEIMSRREASIRDGVIYKAEYNVASQ